MLMKKVDDKKRSWAVTEASIGVLTGSYHGSPGAAASKAATERLSNIDGPAKIKLTLRETTRTASKSQKEARFNYIVERKKFATPKVVKRKDGTTTTYQYETTIKSLGRTKQD